MRAFSTFACSRPTGHMAVWRNGSASDPRSEGWEFESLCGHFSFGRARAPSRCAVNVPYRRRDCPPARPRRNTAAAPKRGQGGTPPRGAWRQHRPCEPKTHRDAQSISAGAQLRRRARSAARRPGAPEPPGRLGPDSGTRNRSRKLAKTPALSPQSSTTVGPGSGGQ